MSAPGADRIDVNVLAAGEARLTRRYALASFRRLGDLLASPQGEVAVKLGFHRLAEGLAACELEAVAVATLRCQRCLEPFEQTLRCEARLAFVAGEDEAGQVPEEFEAVPAPAGRVDIGELVEDELLLSLPVVALHAAGTRCAETLGQPAAGAASAPAAKTHRPFAGLQELLKH